MLWAQSTHKGLHQGWTQSSLYLQVIHFTSHHTTCHDFFAYFYSASTQHRNPHHAGWPILSCGPTQELMLATANTWKKMGEVLGENAGERTGRVEIREKSLAVSVACVAIYWPTPGFKGRTFKLYVLTRWDFNFCVRSSHSRGKKIARAESAHVMTKDKNAHVCEKKSRKCLYRRRSKNTYSNQGSRK